MNIFALLGNKYYPYKGESDHRLMNEFSAEFVRLKNQMKECRKCDCENIDIIIGALETMRKLVENHTENRSLFGIIIKWFTELKRRKK